MKLVHRDFRPPRRSRYVAQPLRRRPTLRILLLAAVGLAVYHKYDSFVTSAFFGKLVHPLRLLDSLRESGNAAAPTELHTRGAGLSWSRDSAYLEATCTDAATEVCLEAWNGLGSGEAGRLRALLNKAGAALGLGPLSGFTARYRRIPPVFDAVSGMGPELELDRVLLRSSTDSTLLTRAAGDRPGFCAGKTCLDEIRPLPPFAGFVLAGAGESPPSAADAKDRLVGASLSPLGGNAFQSILKGRIVDLSVAADQAAAGNRMKIYHGKNTFSYYSGFASMRAGLGVGSLVGPGDTLGFMPGNGDSTGALGIGIEKDGLMVDPLAFLGLADSAGSAP